MSDSEDVESMDLLGDNDGPREGQWNGRPDDRIFTEPSVLRAARRWLRGRAGSGD